MPYRLDEVLLVVAAPCFALIVLLFWLRMAAKRTKVVNLEVSFLGLHVTARSCAATESQCLAYRRRASDSSKPKDVV